MNKIVTIVMSAVVYLITAMVLIAVFALAYVLDKLIYRAVKQLWAKYQSNRAAAKASSSKEA